MAQSPNHSNSMLNLSPAQVQAIEIQFLRNTLAANGISVDTLPQTNPGTLHLFRQDIGGHEKKEEFADDHDSTEFSSPYMLERSLEYKLAASSKQSIAVLGDTVVARVFKHDERSQNQMIQARSQSEQNDFADKDKTRDLTKDITQMILEAQGNVTVSKFDITAANGGVGGAEMMEVDENGDLDANGDGEYDDDGRGGEYEDEEEWMPFECSHDSPHRDAPRFTDLV